MSGLGVSRTALVVGGTGGLGAAICRALPDEWGRVAVGYRSGRSAAEDIAADLGGHSVSIHCDLNVAASVTAAIDAANTTDMPLGAIVFAGGVAIEQPFVSTISEAQWRQVIEVELLGFTRLVSAAIPVLRANGGALLRQSRQLRTTLIHQGMHYLPFPRLLLNPCVARWPRKRAGRASAPMQLHRESLMPVWGRSFSWIFTRPKSGMRSASASRCAASVRRKKLPRQPCSSRRTVHATLPGRR